MRYYESVVEHNTTELIKELWLYISPVWLCCRESRLALESVAVYGYVIESVGNVYGNVWLCMGNVYGNGYVIEYYRVSG